MADTASLNIILPTGQEGRSASLALRTKSTWSSVAHATSPAPGTIPMLNVQPKRRQQRSKLLPRQRALRWTASWRHGDKAPGQRHTARGKMRSPATAKVGIWCLPFCGVVSPWCRCNTRGAGLGGRSERRYGDAFIVLRCSDVG